MLRTRAYHGAAVLAATGLAIAGLALPASAAVITTPDATELAQAMAGSTVPITGANFVTLPPQGQPTAVGDSPLAGFPTHGPTYAILTTGDASYANQPGSYPSETNYGGSAGHGNSAYDVDVMRVGINVPSPLNCVHFDFRFLSVEWPEYVGSAYNDAFIAQVDRDDWTTSNSTISAPGNFAFDQQGHPVTINTTGVEAMQPQYAAGTRYDAGTPTLQAGQLVPPGQHSLYFSLFDQGDQVLDSAVLLDNLSLSYAATPADCPSGSLLKSFDLSVTPERAVNQTGATHTVTADLTDSDTHAAVPGTHILFHVTGANTATGTVTTGANGRASFTYPGTRSGEDIITACVQAPGGGCSQAVRAVSVVKAWEASPPHMTLTPASATNDVGTAHTVTAHVTTNDGSVISGGHVLFQVEGANNVTGSGTTNAAGDATFTYPGTGDGHDDITACYDANDNGTCDLDELIATAAKTWVVPDPVLTLTQVKIVEPVGAEHTVTATVLSDHTARVANARVVFTVAGVNHATGEGLTNADGTAEFTYTGLHPGRDTITACFDANQDDKCDAADAAAPAAATLSLQAAAAPGDPPLSASVSAQWVPASLQISPAAAVNTVGQYHTVTATLDTGTGAPVRGGLVLFTVTGANHGLKEAVTTTSGRATVTYHGLSAGTDHITACHDINMNRRCDPGEPRLTALKTWLPEVPVTG